MPKVHPLFAKTAWSVLSLPVMFLIQIRAPRNKARICEFQYQHKSTISLHVLKFGARLTIHCPNCLHGDVIFAGREVCLLFFIAYGLINCFLNDYRNSSTDKNCSGCTCFSPLFTADVSSHTVEAFVTGFHSSLM